MRTHTPNRRPLRAARELLGRAQAGFTMLEMVVAMMVLMVGLLALASAVGYALSVSNSGRNVTNTKLLVVSVLEQMENLRNTRELTFGQLANTNEVDNTGSTVAFGGFLAGLQDVTKTPGPDGIYGTADDKTSPGPNGTYGDSDDVPNDSSLVVAGYKRQIAVTVLDTGLKKIEVTLQYPGGDGRVRTMKGSSYLNDDARSNYLR